MVVRLEMGAEVGSELLGPQPRGRRLTGVVVEGLEVVRPGVVHRGENVVGPRRRIVVARVGPVVGQHAHPSSSR
jgi:hypothetical protein